MKNEFINSLPWICSQNFVVISSERYRARDSNSTNLAKRFLGNCQAAKYSPALANSPVFNQECISRNFVAGRFQFYGLYYEISRARNVYPQRTIPSHLTLIVIKRLLGKISSRRTRRNILSRRKLIFFLLLRVEIFSPLIHRAFTFSTRRRNKRWNNGTMATHKTGSRVRDRNIETSYES